MKREMPFMDGHSITFKMIAVNTRHRSADPRIDCTVGHGGTAEPSGRGDQENQ
jgi:hypothetical protein